MIGSTNQPVILLPSIETARCLRYTGQIKGFLQVTVHLHQLLLPIDSFGICIRGTFCSNYMYVDRSVVKVLINDLKAQPNVKS